MRDWPCLRASTLFPKKVISPNIPAALITAKPPGCSGLGIIWLGEPICCPENPSIWIFIGSPFMAKTRSLRSITSRPAAAASPVCWSSRERSENSIAGKTVDFSALSATFSVMFAYDLDGLPRCLCSAFRSRHQLVLENLALRHQLAVLMRSVRKPKLRSSDRFLWVLLRRLWSGWHHSLVMVVPRTVVGWHRQGFRLFWRWKSRSRGGRPSTNRELIGLIRQMWSSNPTWGSKRIQAELAKLGIGVSDSTVRKYRPKARAHGRDQTWKSFLKNHAQELVAVDFFAVPTATFRVLYVFLVLAHERRRVLHFNVTDSPSSAWTGQQLTEAFPFCNPPRYLLRDRDSIYGVPFQRRAAALSLEQKLIAARSPWQNPCIERLIGSIRRECLDHVIVLHAHHLKRLLAEYFQYYHRHRPHRSLEQDCPEPRAVEAPDQGNIIELPLVGGLHHRYARQAA